MNKEQRKKANLDQIERFFASYYPSWRLHQILTNEKLIAEKFTFYSSIIEKTKQFDDSTGDYTIAQEITNGLYMETIAYCVQYIEDLFALLKAGKNIDFFIKNIITYDAGSVENYTKEKMTEKKMCDAFYFPYFEKEPEKSTTETTETYYECISRLLEWMKEIKEFFIQHQFFYKQYKHGLTIALRPYNIFSEEQVTKAKTGNFEPYLAALDNLELTKLKDKKDRFNGYVFIPNLTENISPNIQQLMKEDNLIRYVFPPKETNMAKIKDIAFKVRECINIFSNNIIVTAREENPLKLHLPAAEIGKVCAFSFDSFPLANQENEKPSS